MPQRTESRVNLYVHKVHFAQILVHLVHLRLVLQYSSRSLSKMVQTRVSTQHLSKCACRCFL